MTVVNVLIGIVSKLIIYENAFPLRNQALLSYMQVKYVEYIIVTGYPENLGISRKESIQITSDI